MSPTPYPNQAEYIASKIPRSRLSLEPTDIDLCRFSLQFHLRFYSFIIGEQDLRLQHPHESQNNQLRDYIVDSGSTFESYSGIVLVAVSVVVSVAGSVAGFGCGFRLRFRLRRLKFKVKYSYPLPLPVPATRSCYVPKYLSTYTYLL